MKTEAATLYSGYVVGIHHAMFKKYWNQFVNSNLYRYLLSTPAPHWMVLMADLTFVALSCLLTFTFSRQSEPTVGPYWIVSPWLRTALIVFIYGVCGLLLHSNQYIVRLSVLVDLHRTFLMAALASVLIFTLNLCVEATVHILYIRVWNIFLIGVFSFSSMLMMRLALKYLFAVLTTHSADRERVIVLGSSINSYLIANGLKNENNGRFLPVALMSVNNKLDTRSIENIPVVPYKEDTVGEVFEKYNCSTLIFLSSQYEFVREELADVMLNNNIKLLMLNQVEEFDSTNNEKANLSPHVKSIKIEDLLGRDPIKTQNPAIKRQIRNQVVMITGAAGSIGSEIVRQVSRLGALDVVLVDQAESPMHELQLEMAKTLPNVKIHLFIGDIANRVRMRRAFEKYKPRYVFHAAAYKHVPMMERNPTEAILTNVFGTKNIADLSLEYNVEKFVMISTDKAVNPTNIMGASKRIAEIYVQSLFFHARNNGDFGATKFITTRFGNVLGSNGSVIPLFRRQIEEGGPVTVTHRDIIRYFMTIPEACSLVLEAGCMGQGGEIYIFDMGSPVKIYDLACRMISLAGLKVGRDIQIVETGLRPGEKLYEELLNDKELTIATHHQKIMIAKVRVYDYNDVLAHLKVLREAIDNCDTYSLVSEMKHMVPEYHSQNSEWEAVDKEIERENSHYKDLTTI